MVSKRIIMHEYSENVLVIMINIQVIQYSLLH